MSIVTDFLHTPAGQARLQHIAAVARRIGEAAQGAPHATSLYVIDRTVLFQPGGMCDRQARQIHEIAGGLPDHGWEFAAGSAAATEELLRAHGRELDGCVPGCVLLFDDGDVGHIAVYVGDGLVVENTSSWRGDPSRPGTKIAALSDVEAAHGGAEGRAYYAGIVG